MTSDSGPLTMPTSSLTVCLPTADLDSAYRFYREAVGFPVIGVPVGPDERPEPVQFELPTGAFLMLIPTGGFGWVTPGQSTAPRGTAETVLTLRAWTRTAVDSLVTRAAAGGGEIRDEENMQVFGYTRWFTDLDSHLWMVTTSDPGA